jgi:glutathione synthase/RimK-type ligase-like ATP-grasp enzyme
VSTIVLLTAEVLPHDDLETHLVAEALAGLGVSAVVLPWTSPELTLMSADLAVIRSTWDYTHRLADFLTVLEGLPMPLRNSVDVVRWNSHKGYLVELANAGVPVVPTTLYRRGEAAALPDLGSAEIIVKPAVSAGGRGVGRFAAGSPAAAGHLTAMLSTTDALVQPFQPEVLAGERSLIFLGGTYSHAVRKTPVDGDFRVQERYGGSNRVHAASAAEVAVARAAMAEVPGGAAALLYARVDLIGDQGAPLVMELELIEPELFLPQAPGSADLLAKAAIAQL